MSYKHECLVTVIKLANVASSNDIQHILKIVIFNTFSLGLGACVCAVCLSMCVYNYECMHNLAFYITKRKMCKFKICSIMS